MPTPSQAGRSQRFLSTRKSLTPAGRGAIRVCPQPLREPTRARSPVTACRWMMSSHGKSDKRNRGVLCERDHSNGGNDGHLPGRLNASAARQSAREAPRGEGPQSLVRGARPTLGRDHQLTPRLGTAACSPTMSFKARRRFHRDRSRASFEWQHRCCWETGCATVLRSVPCPRLPHEPAALLLRGVTERGQREEGLETSA